MTRTQNTYLHWVGHKQLNIAVDLQLSEQVSLSSDRERETQCPSDPAENSSQSSGLSVTELKELLQRTDDSLEADQHTWKKAHPNTELRVQSIKIMHVRRDTLADTGKETNSYGGCAARNEAYSQCIDNDQDTETLS